MEKVFELKKRTRVFLNGLELGEFDKAVEINSFSICYSYNPNELCIYNIEGKVILSEPLKVLHIYDSSFILVENDDGLQGVYSFDGKNIIPTRFSKISFTWLDLDLLPAKNEMSLWGAYRTDGTLFIPNDFLGIYKDEYGIIVKKGIDGVLYKGYYAYDGTIVPAEFKDIDITGSGCVDGPGYVEVLKYGENKYELFLPTPLTKKEE